MVNNSLESCMAIQQYRSKKGILQQEKFFHTKAIVHNLDGREIYNDMVECCFHDEAQYSQILLNIQWNINEKTRITLGLHNGFNTNYQVFEYNDKYLIVTNFNQYVIYLEV